MIITAVHEGGKNGENQKGLITIDRKIKKDAFYLYKAYWNKKEPFVHICGSRYEDRAEDVTLIKVYSNCDHIDLYMNGNLISSQDGEHVFEFRISISDEYDITAVGKNGIQDEIHIRHVTKPNPAYQFGQTGSVTNWFDKDTFDPNCYSIQDTLADLKGNAKTKPIIDALMEKAHASRGEVAQSTASNPNLERMMGAMKLSSVLKSISNIISEDEIKELNAQLQKVSKS